MEKHVKNLRLPLEIKQRLEKASGEMGITVHAYIMLAITEKLKEDKQ